MVRARSIDIVLLMGPEAQFWLCGCDSFLGALLQQALIFAADGKDPVLVV